jgi:hypothetical protein
MLAVAIAAPPSAALPIRTFALLLGLIGRTLARQIVAGISAVPRHFSITVEVG